MTAVKLNIQHACQDALPFKNKEISAWVRCALQDQSNKVELTLRFVDANEMTSFNHTYRKQNKATNVLAFPSNLPKEIPQKYFYLGDIVICPAVLYEESLTLKTDLMAHWAHIVIHGVLHLLGYDHIDDHDALIMKTLEINILKQLGFQNPYVTEDTSLEE